MSRERVDAIESKRGMSIDELCLKLVEALSTYDERRKPVRERADPSIVDWVVQVTIWKLCFNSLHSFPVLPGSKTGD